MIVTVTLNAAWDKTYFVDGLRPGETHIVADRHGCAGGKGINVARVVAALGGRVVATGLAGGPTGRAIVEGLAGEGIETAFHPIRADSRTTLAVVDRTAGAATEFREPGGPISAAESAGFAGHLERLLDGASFCVFAGSLPPGLPADTYARLVELARRRGVRAVLDTSGPALVEGVRARPFMLKPNVEEAAALAKALGLGQAASGPDQTSPARGDPVVAALRLAARFAEDCELAVLSLGRLGVVACRGAELWHATVELKRIVNPVGSGDALIAGVIVALERGDAVADALRLGVAAGAANALTETAGDVRPGDVARLLPEVEVREVTR